MIRTFKGLFLAGLLVVLGLGATGCAAPAPAPAPSSPAEAGTGQDPSSGSAPAQVEAMRPEAKKTMLAQGFPVEVPVPAGKIISANSQGPDAWDYEVEVDATPETLRDWYSRAYTSRSWTIVDYGQLTQAAEGYFIELRKNAAQSRVDVVGREGASPATARVVVGVGAPVLETF